MSTKSSLDFSVKVETPASPCIECGYLTNGVSGSCIPAEGDLTLCINCGSLNAFTADLRLRQPTLEEYLEVAKDSDFQLARKAILEAKRKAEEQRQQLESSDGQKQE